jgi:hypothetical protein
MKQEESSFALWTERRWSVMGNNKGLAGFFSKKNKKNKKTIDRF